MFRSWFCLAFLFFLILGLPVHSLTGNLEEQKISLGFYEYGLLYHQGEGIDADVVRELERRSGRTFFSSVLARARIWKDLESGNLDMTVSGISIPEREKFAWFIPYFSMKNYALVLKLGAKTSTQGGFIAEPSWNFGAVAAFRHGELQDRFLETLRGQKRVEEAPDAFTLFQKLRAGRIQGIFSQPPVYAFYLKELGMESKVELIDWFPSEKKIPHGLVLSKKRFDIQDFNYWQNLVQDIKTDGSLEKILIKHLGVQAGRELLVLP